MAYREKLDITTMWFVGFLTIFGTIATILGLQTYYFIVQQAEVEQKVVQGQPRDYRELSENQKAKLATYGVVNAEGRTFRVPIDVAMEKMVSQRSR